MKLLSEYSVRAAHGTLSLGGARSVARLLLFVVMAAAFVILTLAVFSYTRNTTETMESELCQKMQVSVEQTCNNIDYRFDQAAESGSALIGTLYPYLNSQGDVTVQLQEYTEIRRALSEQLDKHMISRLRLYVPDTKIYSGQQTTLYALNSLERDKMEIEPYLRGGVFWEETHPVSLGLSAPIQVISCVVAMKSQADYNSLCGVLFADIGVAQFHDIFKAGTTGGDKMFLVNAQGVVLAGENDDLLGQTAISVRRMAEICSVGKGYLLDSDMVLAFSRLKTADWYVVTSMDRNRVYTMDTGVVNTIVLMWVAACAILFIISVTVAYSLYLNRTVRRINLAIRTLDGSDEPNNTQSAPAHRRRGGPASLERDTEQIVRSITDVVEARYRDKLAISEYQMESLQAQIKPHFLYNTLDVLKWMILDKNLDDSVWMVNALSKYLRMSINKGEPIVPLSEELALTQTYLGIMQKRFEHRFEVEYDLDNGAMDCLIPKFSLQPLVENALLHGILYCDKPDKRLVIRTWRSAKAFGIEIEDNGTGMSQEAAQHLTEIDVHGGQSYGVANVHKRLDIFGNGECKFNISSREGMGTCVMIQLPLPQSSKKEL